MAAIRHLGFVMHMFRPPKKGIWGSLSLCKIWLESIQSYDNMQVVIFCGFGWKTPIHRPKLFLGQHRGSAMLTPTNSFLLLRVITSLPLSVKIDQEMRP